MPQPTNTEYLTLINAVYAGGQSGNIQLPPGYITIAQSNPALQAQGYIGVAIRDPDGNVIVVNNGTQPGTTTYGGGSLGADARIANGSSPQALQDASDFLNQVAKTVGSGVYTTGNSLGGTQSEAQVYAHPDDVLGGATYGATGLPGYSGPPSTALTDYINQDDPVGNLASDPQSGLNAAAPANMNHYGTVVRLNDAGGGSIVSALSQAMQIVNNGASDLTQFGSALASGLENFAEGVAGYHLPGAYGNTLGGLQLPPGSGSQSPPSGPLSAALGPNGSQNPKGWGMMSWLPGAFLGFLQFAGGLFEGAFDDPLVIDVSGQGLSLTAASSGGVSYDLNGSGLAAPTGWIGAGTGLLGIVNNQTGALSLFGSGASDGFTALAALDTNGDGVINSSDAQFGSIVVWMDQNGDGVAEPSELHSLSSLGIVSINLATTPTEGMINGNIIQAISSVTMSDGTTREIADVSFATLLPKQNNGNGQISNKAEAFPDFVGNGTLSELRVAMTADPTLLQLAQQAVNIDPTDSVSFDQAFTQMLYRWAGVDGVSPDARGPLYDAQKLEFMEGIFGVKFSGWGQSNPIFLHQTGTLGEAYDRLIDGLKARFLVQDSLAPVSSFFYIDQNSNAILADTNIATDIIGLSDVITGRSASTTIIDWTNALLVINDAMSGEVTSGADAGNDIPGAVEGVLDALAPVSFDAQILHAAADGMLNVVDVDSSAVAVPGTSVVFGSAAADLFVIDGSNMEAVGFGGDDEFLMSAASGYGAVEISESNYIYASTAVLQFGLGVSAANLTITSTPEGDMVITDGVTGDGVTVDGEFSGANGTFIQGVAQISFADGSSLTRQQLINLVTTGSPTNTRLHGTGDADTLDPNGYAHYAQGDGGQDTFVYKEGYGAVEINEANYIYTSPAVLQLGPGMTAADVSITRDASGNMFITDGVTGDGIQVDGEFNLFNNNYTAGVAQIDLADGTSLSHQQLVDMMNTGSPTNTVVYGTGNADTLDPNGYATYVQGNGGQDTFVYKAGYGAVEVNENNYIWNADATLQLGPGITAANMVATHEANGDMVITDGVTGDSVTVDGEFSNPIDGVAQVVLSDGTAFTYQQLVDGTSTAGPGQTQLYGTGGSDTLDPNGYATYVQGNGGQDTFVYKAGYGAVEINENNYIWNADATLQLGPGITAANIVVTHEANGDMVITDGVTGDSVTVDGEFSNPIDGVGQVVLSDGTTLTYQQLVAATSTAKPAQTQLFGTGGSETLDPNGYATYVQGNGGQDTFVYKAGYGAVEVNENNYIWNADATLQLGPGITAANMVVTHEANGDMVITDGVTGDSVTVDGEFSTPIDGVAQVVLSDGTAFTYQQLVDGTSTAGPGQTQLYGTGGSDTLDPNGYATYVQGNGGQDTFVYKAGYGAVEINENNYIWNADATLLLGPGITAANIVVTHEANGDMVITDGVTGDSVTVDGEFSNPIDGVAQVVLSDGTTFTRQQFINFTTTGAPGRTQLYGTGGNETFDPNGYAHYVQGDGGVDTFIYNEGYGAVEINENNYIYTSQSVLEMGAGITAGDLWVTRDNNGDMILTDGVSGDQLTVDGEFNLFAGNFTSGVSQINFADGTSLTRAQLTSMALSPGQPLITLNRDAGGNTSSISINYGGAGSEEGPIETLDMSDGSQVSQDSSGNVVATYTWDGINYQLNISVMGNVSTTATNGAGEVVAFNVRQTPKVRILFEPGSGDNSHFAQRNGAPGYGEGASGDVGEATEDPLVMDVSGQGLQLSPLSGSMARYDFTGNHAPEPTGWIGTGTGFLVMQDPSGQITASDMFGPGSPNGFSALAALDSNGDGKIDASDALFSDLAVWQDTNGDGVAEAGEVQSLSALGVQSMSLSTTNIDQQLNGNAVETAATVTMTDGSTREIADVTFASSPADRYIGNGTVSTAAAALPDLIGYGQLTNLRVAMTTDVQLLTDVQSLVENPPSDPQALDDAISQIMLRWAGVDGVDPTSRGPDADAQKLDFLEKFLGKPFVAWGYSNPHFNDQTILLSNAYTAMLDGIKARLLVQQSGSALGQLFAFDADADAIVPLADYGTTALAIGALASSASTDQATIFNALLVFSEAVQDSALTQDYMTMVTGVLDLSALPGVTADIVAAAAHGTLTYVEADAANDAVASNPTVYGTFGADLINLGGPAVVIGEGGGDEFYVGKPAGNIEIVEGEQAGIGRDALVFGEGISEWGLVVNGDASGDLLLTYDAAGDQIKLDGSLLNAGSGVGQVVFADGTILTRDQLVALAVAGGPGKTHLFGTGGADTIDPLGYARYVQGNGGVDTFVYDEDYGAVEINENNYIWNADATLQLGPGITAANMVVTHEANGDMVITDGVTGDSVTVDGEFSNPIDGVAQVVLSDGTAFTYQQLVDATAIGGPGRIALYGTGGNEILDPNGYARYAQGNGGQDTFVYKEGYGAVEINENNYIYTSPAVLQLGLAMTAADVSITRDASGNLIITDGVTGDRVLVDGEFNLFNNNYTAGVVQIDFADGSSLTHQQLVDMMNKGSPTNTTIYGTGNADTIDPNGYAHYVQGNGGVDTFVYNAGYGAVEINENNYIWNAVSTLQLGPGITAANLIVTHNPNGNMVLTDGASGDSITVDGEFDNPIDGVAQVVLSDGTTFTRQQLIDATSVAGPGQTQLYGTGGSETLDPNGYAAYVQGNGGQDTFIYKEGYGAVEINEANYIYTSPAVLQLGPGMTAADVSITRDASGNMFITDGVTGDGIQVDGEFNLFNNNYTAGVAQIDLADGTSLSHQQLVDMMNTGSPTNTVIYGTGNADTIDPNGYAHYLQGDGGVDTFLYNEGYGAVEINENNYIWNAVSTLQLGPGITAANMVVTHEPNGNLVITDGVTGDGVTVDGEFANPIDGVAQVVLSDGTTFTYQQLINFTTTGAPGRTQLYGTGGADLFDPNGYATYVQGNGGVDTFIYKEDYGAVEINENNYIWNAVSTLQLGPGITAANIVVTHEANGDMVITDGVTGDSVTVDGEFSNPIDGVGQVVLSDGTTLTYQQLVAATSTAKPEQTQLFGTGGSEILDPNGYATYVQGNGGVDTFVYNEGYGAVEVNENNYIWSAVSTLQLGPGITAANMVVTHEANGNMVITDGVTGDSVTVDGEFTNPIDGVAQVALSNGTTFTYQQLVNFTTTGAPGRTALYGTGGNEAFDPNGYATYEQGNGGLDTFIYNQGDGAVEINENNWIWTSPAVLQLGPGFTAANLAVSRDANGNMFLTDGVSGDRITLDGEFALFNNNYTDGVAQINFADGTSLNHQQLVNLMTTGSLTNTMLYGTGYSDVFDPKGYAHYALGDGGIDTFIYNQGYGAVEINENNYIWNAVATLQLGPGITVDNMVVTRDAGGNMFITDGVTGDQITVDGEFANPIDGVAQVVLADGTALSLQQLSNLTTIGSPTNTVLYGTGGGDLFRSNGYATYMQGNGGADTFVYGAGDGQLEISDDNGWWQNSAAVLQLGTGITASQLQAVSDGSGNLILTDGVAGDRIVLDSELLGSWDSNNAEYGIASVEFADGTSLTHQQIIDLETTGSPENTTLYGTGAAEIFDSKGYATTARGSGGADSFIYDQGYGHLDISEDDGDANSAAVLELGPGLTLDQIQIWSTAQGNMVITDTQSGDQVNVDGEFNTNWDGNNEWGVGSIQFADGSTLSRDQIAALAAPMPIIYGDLQDPSLYGSSGADVFDSLGYSDYEQGNGGGDTFVYNQGYGSLNINESNDPSVATSAVVAFGPGITASDLSATQDWNGDLFLTDGVTGDQIQVWNEFGSWDAGPGPQSSGISGARFADGTSLSFQQLADLAATGSPGTSNAEIHSYTGNTIFDSRGYADYAEASGGQNTFIYDRGYGQLEVWSEDDDPGAQNVLSFGAGIDPSQLVIGQDRWGDIVITDGTDGDQLTLDSMVDAADNNWGDGEQLGVQSIQFADGTTWTGDQLIAKSMIGAPGSDDIEGTLGPDLIDGKGYATYAEGNGGNDTFIFSPGYGFLEVDEEDFGPSPANVLQLGSGFTPGDMSVSQYHGDIFLDDYSTGDEIELDRELYGDGDGVQTVTFADGTQWTQAQMQAMSLIGSADNNTSLEGTDGADLIDSRGYATYEDGSGGGDTFIYNAGYGPLEISEWDTGPTNVLQFGNSIDPTNLLVTADGAGDLTITDGVAGDRIVLDGALLHALDLDGYQVGVEEISFADGASVATTNIARNGVETPTFTWTAGATGDDFIGSGVGLNIFNLSAGAHSITAGAADNLFEYNSQAGQAILDLSPSSGANELDFGAGVSNEALWFEQSGEDLKIDLLGTGAEVTVANWYQSGAVQLGSVTAGGEVLDTQIAQLVSAMATYAAANPSFSPLTASAIPTDSSLQMAVSSAWHR